MRIIAIILCVVMLLSLCGCGKQAKVKEPITFYYCVNQIDHQGSKEIFGTETRDASIYADDLVALYNAYFAGPENSAYYNPFPQGSYVVSSTQEGNILTLYLSEHFDVLPLEKLTLAISCLAKTTFGHSSALIMVLIPHGAFIDGSTYKTFTADSFLYSDENTTYSTPQ